jgi:subfamily B ATP-binding cassette protein MsbA
MQNAVSNALTGIIKDFFAIIFLIGVIFYRDFKLAIVAMILFPIAFFPIVKFSKKMRQSATKSQQILGSLSSILQETISGAKLIKAFGTEKYEIDKFKGENANLFGQTMKLFKVQALSAPLSEVLAGFGAAAVILYGGLSVIEGTSTPGNFFSFITALFMLYEPVKRLSRVNNIIQQGFAGQIQLRERICLGGSKSGGPTGADGGHNRVKRGRQIDSRGSDPEVLRCQQGRHTHGWLQYQKRGDFVSQKPD